MGFGLSKSKNKSRQNSVSENVNNSQLSGAFAPATGATSTATDLLTSLFKGGPNGFADSNGYDFLLKKGADRIDSGMAAKGLLQSGAEVKGLEDYRHGLASSYMNDYIGGVDKLGQLGIGAGGVLASSGNKTVSSTRSKGKSGSVSAGKNA